MRTTRRRIIGRFNIVNLPCTVYQNEPKSRYFKENMYI
jgi:hypothetical protein